MTNLIATPPPGDEYRFDRDTGPGTPACAGDPRFEDRMRWLFARHATRRSRDPGPDAATMPAGYVYLAQLVAHDMVQTAAGREMWRVGRHSSASSDQRTTRLRLETLYGDTADPGRFTGDGRFRLGRAAPVAGCPMSDIPRDGPLARLADTRNDDHAIIAQLAALLMQAHNTIAAHLPAGMPGAARLAAARAALTLAYRAVVRHDLLPRLLAPRVLNVYGTDAPPYLDTQPPGAVPVEFSHAAFRFGHVMPRSNYCLNDRPGGAHPLPDVLTFTSAHRRTIGTAPLLTDSWVVDWSLLFDAPPAGHRLLNRAHPIEPLYQAPFQVPGNFIDGGTAEPRLPLPLRDLLSCGIARPWSVPALTRKIAGAAPAGLLPRWLVQEHWRASMMRWLGGHAGDPDACDVLADPPLVFFVQFEAMYEEDDQGRLRGGTTLGTLGSIIVAEVLGRALDQPPLAMRPGTDLADALAELGRTRLGDAKAFATLAAALPARPRFIDLASFVARSGCAGAVPPLDLSP